MKSIISSITLPEVFISSVHSRFKQSIILYTVALNNRISQSTNERFLVHTRVCHPDSISFRIQKIHRMHGGIRITQIHHSLYLSLHNSHNPFNSLRSHLYRWFIKSSDFWQKRFVHWLLPFSQSLLRIPVCYYFCWIPFDLGLFLTPTPDLFEDPPHGRLEGFYPHFLWVVARDCCVYMKTTAHLPW